MKRKVNNSPKIQHYVPQFILKNFCFKNEQVYVFDKKTERVFPAHTKNIAAESGFYDFELDNKRFTIDPNFTDLEANTAGIFEKIIKQESLLNITKDEKAKLSIFIAAQFVRTKHFRVMAQQLNRSFIHQIEKMGIDPKEVKELHTAHDDEFEKDIILAIGDNVIEYAPIFESRNWILLKSPTETDYHISDNPITLYNSINRGKANLGLAVKGIEVYFPISPRLLIGIFDKTTASIIRKNHELVEKIDDQRLIQVMQNLLAGLDESKVVQSDSEEAQFQNSLQVVFATRFVYSQNQDFKLVKELLSSNPQYKEPPQLYGAKVD